MNPFSIIAYLIITVSVGYAFIYPGLGDIFSLMEEKQKYEESLRMVSNIENKKEELLTKLNDIKPEDRESIDTVLPDSLSFVKLASQIDAVASRYGISVSRISGQDKDPSVGESIGEAQPENPYNSAIIDFTFSGPYDKFQSFLGDLEKSLRILDVKSVDIESNENGVYSYNVKFETYWLK